MTLNVHNTSAHTVMTSVQVIIRHPSGTPVFTGTSPELRFVSDEIRSVPVSVSIPEDAPTGTYEVIGRILATPTH